MKRIRADEEAGNLFVLLTSHHTAPVMAAAAANNNNAAPPPPPSPSPADPTTMVGKSSLSEGTKAYEEELARERLLQAAAYPAEEMPSCLSMFDQWAMCWAPAKQIKRVYRYGSIMGCEQAFDDWKRCLSFKHLPPEERYAAWIDQRARQVLEKRQQGSSEDVWESRSGPLVDSDYMPRIQKELLDSLAGQGGQ